MIKFPGNIELIDNANRGVSSGPPLGPNWSDRMSSIDNAGVQVINNQVGSALNIPNQTNWLSTIFKPDQCFTFEMPVLPGPGNYLGIFLRMEDVGNSASGYGLFLTDTLAEIYQINDGVYAPPLASIAVAWVAGDIFGAEAVGAQISIYRKPSGQAWTKVLTVANSVYSPAQSRMGLFVDRTTSRIDNISGGSIIHPWAQEFYDALGWFRDADESTGWQLKDYATAMSLMVQDVRDWSEDTGAGPGWSQVLDADLCPVEFLPWLGALVGVALPGGLTEQQQRDRIHLTDGFKRGSPGALIGAAQQHLTGAKSVFIIERTPTAYSFSVNTYAGETPNSALVLAALLEQKPAGLNMTYIVLGGQSWSKLRTVNATWQIANSTYATWQLARDAT